MQITSLVKLTNFVSSTGIDSYHSQMFHGVADLSRRGSLPGGQVDPLRLSKNVHRLAEVIEPEINLVLSEQAVTSVPAIGHITRLPVEFSCLFDMPWEEGDFSYRTRLREVSVLGIPEFILSQSHDVSLYVPRYFELQPIDLDGMDLTGEATHGCKIRVGLSYFKHVELPIRLLAAEGMVNYGMVHVFTSDAFKQIERFIDLRFFLKYECDLSRSHLAR